MEGVAAPAGMVNRLQPHDLVGVALDGVS